MAQVYYKKKIHIQKNRKLLKNIDPEESCCVCYEIMNENDNLVYCKFSCGRNLHTECMERWVKLK